MSSEIKRIYKFGDFKFDAEKRVLWRSGEIVALTPKSADVLYCLLKSRGDLVERETLIEDVWPDTFVEEGNLNHAISALRRALGDTVIQTVPRRGYRFATDVIEVVDDPAQIVIVEKQTLLRRLIEEHEEIDGPPTRTLGAQKFSSAARLLPYAGVVAILLLVLGGVWFLISSGETTKSSIKSIAVLPLKSFSTEQTDAEMRLRITDALITKLGTFDKLAVRPTGAVLRYSDQETNIVEAGRALGVDAILDGRVQAENGRLRVTLQLVSVETGHQLWSEQFDGRSGEILGLQDAITNRLQRDLAFVENARANLRPSPNNDAYEAYLKGRFLWNQRRRESYFKALEYFQEAVAIDPKFSLGYTGISDCYHLLQQTNELSTQEAFARAEVAARKALELDPSLPEANVSAGSVAFLRYSRWSEAEGYYKRAIELNPNLPEAYARLGMLYNAWGRFDEAYESLKRAEALDPTSVNNAIYLGANFYFSKQFDRASNQFNRILEFSPNTERVHFFLARIYEITGRHELAVEHSLKEREVSRPQTVEPLRAVYERSGIRGFWIKQIELLKEESKTQFDLENAIASRYVLLGDYETASKYIEQNLNNFGTMRNYGMVDPIFEPLKATQQYKDLMKRSEPVI